MFESSDEIQNEVYKIFNEFKINRSEYRLELEPMDRYHFEWLLTNKPCKPKTNFNEGK